MGHRRMRAATAALTALLVVTTLAASAVAAPQVLWVDNTVTAKPLGDGKSRAFELQPTDYLPEAARLVVSDGGALWFMDEGIAFGLHGPGVWDLAAGAEIQGSGRTTRISLAALGLDGEPRVPWIEIETSPKPDARVTLVSPVETAVTTRRPVLRWRAHAAIRRVDLTLVRRDEGTMSRPVERWRGLTSTHHEVSRPLEPGHDYRWELRVAPENMDGAPPGHWVQTSSWFRVLSDEAIRAVRRLDSTISTYQLDTPEAVNALEVVRALMWEQHGMAAAARAAWDELLVRAGDVEALRLYRARLGLRVLARPREARARPADKPSATERP